MKKVIILLILSGLVFTSFAQFRSDINASLFAGSYLEQQNTSNHGNWYGLYLEYMPINNSNGLNVGLAALASQVNVQNARTLNKSKGSSFEFGLGLAAGKYKEYLSPTFSGYLGANLLLKSSQEINDGVHVDTAKKTIGYYYEQRKDVLLAGEVNINLLKSSGLYRENLFPRTQLRLQFQTPLKSSKDLFWNETLVEDTPIWNKASQLIQLKQSIVQLGHLDLLLEPKVYLGYYHYNIANASNWFSYGLELGLKKRGWDDFLSIYFFIKKRIGQDYPGQQFIFGINVMPMNMKQK